MTRPGNFEFNAALVFASLFFAFLGASRVEDGKCMRRLTKNPGTEERAGLERHLAFDKEWNSYPFSDVFIVDEWATMDSPQKGD